MWPYEDDAKTFALAMVNQFELRPDAVQIGVVEFDSDATMPPLSSDRAAVQTAINSRTEQAAPRTSLLGSPLHKTCSRRPCRHRFRLFRTVPAATTVTATTTSCRDDNAQVAAACDADPECGPGQMHGNIRTCADLTAFMALDPDVDCDTLIPTAGVPVRSICCASCSTLGGSGATTSPPLPPPPPVACDNTCSHASDGDCDDGGPGAEYSLCAHGTDCADCGTRSTVTLSPTTPRSGGAAYGNVQQWILILTDGEQNRQYGGDQGAISTAETVKNAGVTVVAVGFGGSDTQTLNAMATAPASLYSYRGSSIADVQAHLSSMCTIIASPRQPPPPSPPMPCDSIVVSGYSCSPTDTAATRPTRAIK